MLYISHLTQLTRQGAIAMDPLKGLKGGLWHNCVRLPKPGILQDQVTKEDGSSNRRQISHCHRGRLRQVSVAKCL